MSENTPVETDVGGRALPVAPVALDQAPVRLRLGIAYDGTDFSGWTCRSRRSRP
jgi:hypothetical protein